jgi:hypothetical protein
MTEEQALGVLQITVLKLCYLLQCVLPGTKQIFSFFCIEFSHISLQTGKLHLEIIYLGKYCLITGHTVLNMPKWFGYSNWQQSILCGCHWTAHANGSTLSLEHMQETLICVVHNYCHARHNSVVLPLFKMPSCHCKFADKLQRDNPFHKDTAMKWIQLGVHTGEVLSLVEVWYLRCCSVFSVVHEVWCSWHRTVFCMSWCLVSILWKCVFCGWSLVFVARTVFIYFLKINLTTGITSTVPNYKLTVLSMVSTLLVELHNWKQWPPEVTYSCSWEETFQ